MILKVWLAWALLFFASLFAVSLGVAPIVCGAIVVVSMAALAVMALAWAWGE